MQVISAMRGNPPLGPNLMKGMILQTFVRKTAFRAKFNEGHDSANICKKKFL